MPNGWLSISNVSCLREMRNRCHNRLLHSPPLGRRGAHGFTLLEVMVALVVLAIALGALSKGVSSYLANATYLQDRTLATWVAENRITELQLTQAWPKADTTKGSALMAGREWYWVQKVTAIEGRPEIRQVQMQILKHPDDKRPLATLIALIGQPQK